MNYYPKVSVAEIMIESGSMKENNDIMIQGITTGILKQKAKDMMIDNKKVLKAEKKDMITIKVNSKVRKNDQVYKIKKR